MLLLRAIRFEALLQFRSLRFRFGALLCLALPILTPYGVLFLLQPHVPHTFGPSSYITIVVDSLRFPTFILALVIAGNRTDIAGGREMWSVLSSAGISNTGYFLRRCLAQIVLLTCLTAIPFISVMGVLAAAGIRLDDPWRPLASWLLLILPVGCGFILLWSALVQITGTELGSLMILAFGRGAATYFLEKVVQPLLGSKIVLHLEWLGFQNLQYFLVRMINLIRWPEDRFFYGDYLATDVPFSVAQLARLVLPSVAVFMGFSLAVASFAPFFLRRTRRDLRPLVVSENHPLRNMIRYVHQLRQRYSPDGALSWERFVGLAGITCFAAAIGYVEHKRVEAAGYAEQRYHAEMQTEDFPPTPSTTRFVDWRVEGDLAPSGIRITSTGLLKHDGDEALDFLAFSLNPFVRVSVQIEGRRTEVERRWDRMRVSLDPALEPGEELTAVFEVSGLPGQMEFDLHGWRVNDSFATRYEAMIEKAYPSARNDLSQSQWEPAISRSGIDLDSMDLTPVLRYGTWQLSPKPVYQGDPGYEVPEPSAFPLLDLSVDLRAPDGWFIGDICGNAADRNGRLIANCRSSLSRYRIRGGLHRIAQADDQVVAAAFPGHEPLMLRHVESLQSAIELSGEAWPGAPAIERLVVVESSLSDNPWFPTGRGGWRASQFQIDGRLIAFNESAVSLDRPMQSEQIVGAVMARELLRRRDLEPSESWAFRNLFSALMSRRMGSSQVRNGATLTGNPNEEGQARYPVLNLEHYVPFVFEQKVPALWTYLESLVGADNLYAGVEDFLSRPSDPPGTLAELFNDIERRGGLSLQIFEDSYLRGHALPKLRLEDVQSRSQPNGRWRLTGKLRNTATGEVTCPVVAKAEGQVIREVVTVTTESATEFAFDFNFPPHTVQLDPEDTCFRWVTRGRMRVERVSLLAGR